MEISFSKIKQTPIDINYSKDLVTIVGKLERLSSNSVKLNSTLNADVNLTCNRCGKEFNRDISENLELILSEGKYNSNDKIDVIEFFDGKIDFDYIIDSEIELIKQDYNFCESCSNTEEILEIEF